MTRRSVMNDRYRVERAGKTRKSASAAKPKRAAGEAASAPSKKASKQKSALGRAVSKGKSHAKGNMPARIEQTPRMRTLRRVWWGFMAAALALAGAMWVLSSNKIGGEGVYRVVLLAYVTAIAGALYLEFGPLRKARVEAVAASKGGKKPPSPKPDKPAGPKADVADDDEAAVTAKNAGRTRFGSMAGLFGGRKTGAGDGDGPE